jgi:hypothetical protein
MSIVEIYELRFPSPAPGGILAAVTGRAGRHRLRTSAFVALVLVATAAVVAGDMVVTTRAGPSAEITSDPRQQSGRPADGATLPAPAPAPTPGSGGLAGPAAATAGATEDGQAWRSFVAQSIDDTTLGDGAVTMPAGANVLAAGIFDGGPSPAYAFHEAGGGAFANQFYPASAIKLLAALGAVTYVATLGFTGEATVDGGPTLHEIYDNAIRNSSNDDYSWLVRIAGVDWLNRDFLPSEGFLATAIQEAYGGEDEQVAYSPAMTLTEGDRSMDVEERSGYDDYGCGGTNCTDLLDLTDAVRRVVLDGEIPAGERFAIAPSDIAGLQDALLGAPSWFEPGVHEVLDPDTRIFSKPGWVGGLDCVDAALVADPVSGRRFLLAASAPDWGDGCDVLATMAGDMLTALLAHDDAIAIRTDGTTVAVAHSRQVTARP